mgnify:CR=1 FL=1
MHELHALPDATRQLLEDFLDGLDLNDGDLVSIDEIEPEIKLNKYLWVILQKELEIGKCKALAEESISRTQAWFDKKENTINAAIEFLSGQMKNYLKQNKLKTLSLPNGNIGFRKQPDIVEITDEELFLTTAASELLRHVPEKFEADLKSIKEYIKTTSEIPPGIELKSKDPKFYYKLNEV